MISSKPTALIADDEPLLREQMQQLLARAWPELDIVAEAANGHEAASLIDRFSPDVAFLDIKMPGLTGIEVAQGIESPTRVVFVTAFDQFAVAAFEQRAVDYLLKPVTLDRLSETVRRLQSAAVSSRGEPALAEALRMIAQRVGHGQPTGGYLRWVRASRGEVTFHIAVEDVFYFQSEDKYTVVHTAAGEHLIRTTLSELAAALDPDRFWQVHRSTIVNMRFVRSSRRDGEGRMTLTLAGVDRPIAVSRAYQGLFRQM